MITNLVIVEMVDTVNFTLTRLDVEVGNFITEVAPNLNIELAYHNYKGCEIYTGNIDNLKLSVSPYRISIKDGSLCKWMLGDNYQTMGRGDIKLAVERLSDIVHLPMECAKVTRLDVGLSIPVKEPVTNYLNHLGTLNYAQRLLQPHSLYYYRHRQAERLCFYDKNREQRDNREPIPDLYKDCHVLRYEQRYMARLPKLLNVPQVTAEMLYNEAFYISLLNQWRDRYRDIRKVHEITLNFQSMKGKRELQRNGILALVERMGGELAFISHIIEAQKRGELTPKQVRDLKNAVKETCQCGGGLTVPSEAITELDKKIATAIAYYR